MRTPEDAEAHLRAIRSLMERATIYRTISAPTALFGSLVALVTTGILWWMDNRSDMEPGWGTFVLGWLIAYVVIDIFNFTLIIKSAKRRGDEWVSPGLKHAAKALAPVLFSGFWVGLCFAYAYNDPKLCAVAWMIFYGLALLATSSFAPRSITVLGATFTALGLAVLPLILKKVIFTDTTPFSAACFVMGATFGLLHLAYAAYVFASTRSRAAALNTGEQQTV